MGGLKRAEMGSGRGRAQIRYRTESSMIGRVTVNGVAIGVPFEEAQDVLGSVKEASARNSVLLPGEKRYLSLNRPEVQFHCDHSGFVKAVMGNSFERDKQLIFKTETSTSSEVLSGIGAPTTTCDGSKQVWSYFELGSNKMGVNFVFQDDLLDCISTIDKVAY